MMTTSVHNLIEMLPSFLKDDPSARAICNAISPIVALMQEAMQAQLIYTNISKLDGETLDKIAWGLNCSWYNPNDTLAARRATIGSALKTFAKLGTVAAVQNSVAINFGDAKVQEWFEYGGTPGTFRVLVEDPSATHERASRFIAIVDAVKSAGSTLDSVVLKTYSPLRVALAMSSIVTRRYRSAETSFSVGGMSSFSSRMAMVTSITRRTRSVETDG